MHYMTWSEVDMWAGYGGSMLGVTRYSVSIVLLLSFIFQWI